MNRLYDRPDGPERYGTGDYFAVVGEDFAYVVSGEMVRFIESVMDRWPRPGWVTFVDLHGSRIRVRTRLITQISQHSADQRAAERAFYRDLRQEQKGEEAWDE